MAKPKKVNVPSRPGSAVSQQFLPSRQQAAPDDWRRHQQQQQTQEQLQGQGKQEQSSAERTTSNNNGTYGYVPFKTAPLPIYGFRANSSNNNNANNNNNNTETVSVKSGKANNKNNNNKADNNVNRPSYPTGAAYTPLNRSESAMSTATGVLPIPGPDPRNLGVCRSASRYQSYTTLPRPEPYDLSLADFYGRHPPAAYSDPPSQLQPIYGIYGAAIYGAPPQRTPSVYGGAPPPTVMADVFQVGLTDKLDQARLKPIINWNILNLSSYLQIVLATGLIGAGVVRLFLHVESSAKNYDLAYGVAALLAAVAGLLAVHRRRRRGFTLAFVAYALSALNVIFFLMGVLQAGVFLPALPLFGGGQPRAHATPAVLTIAVDGPPIVDAFEMEMAVTVLSVLEFITALVSAFYGCKALGALNYHVEAARLSAHYGSDGNSDIKHASNLPYSRPPAPPPMIPYAGPTTTIKRPL